MPEGPDGKTIIIIKKVSGHGGHHGGAWKVAFADFVTAMMALFMVLWLVNSASVVTRERIASYFREPGVFEKGSGTPLEEGGAGILKDAFSPPAEGNVGEITSRKIYTVQASMGTSPDAYDVGAGEGEGEVDKEPKPADLSDLEDLAEKIKEQIRRAAAKAKSQDILGKIEIKVDQRGLHLEIMDTDKSSMFEIGSPKVSPDAEQALAKIATILATLPNPIDIEGHTDGKPFHSSTSDQYDNWNLSADRANAARRILLRAGVKEKQIARVVGYADQRLKVPSDALASANRRISISMRFTELAHKALEGTQTKVTESKPVTPIGAKPKETDGSTVPAPSTQSAKNIDSSDKAASGSKEPQKSLSAVAPTETQEPSIARRAKDEELAAKVKDQSGLTVSLGTTLPEGELIADESGESSNWAEKDKIFGNKNPFFSK